MQPEPDQSRRSTRRLLCCALFALAFLSTASLLERLSPRPELGLLADKLTRFTAEKDEYDVAFFGSSRVYRGIDPERFDAEMAVRHQPLRSFNFGIAGMKPHETNALIRRVLALEPARLRWVMVELGAWDPLIRRPNRFQRRGIFWHDLPETISAMHSALLLERPWHERLDLVATHGLHFAAHSLAAGRGPALFESLFTRSSSKRAAVPPLARRGYAPYAQRSYRTHPMRRYFLEHLNEYTAEIEALHAANRARPSLAHYNLKALADQVAMIRRADAEPVYLILPAPQATPQLYRLRALGYVPWLLAFNDPQRDGALLAIEQRFDREHLSEAGADTLTRRLAERFSHRVLAAGRPPARPGV